MISYIKGKAVSVKSEYAVIECGGIGYKVYMPFSQSAGIQGNDVTVYTYMYIREDIMDLYGFLSEECLELFEILISVSGVGPKAAIGMLDTLSAGAIISAITSGDYKTLTKAPGIGNKTAQRVVLELSNKLKGFSYDESDSPASSADDGIKSEVLAALISLGYSDSDAKAAAARADGAKDVSEGIKMALKSLM